MATVGPSPVVGNLTIAMLRADVLRRYNCRVTDEIRIQGARGHNLQNIDLSTPRDKMVAFTGLSGSGRSFPALDAIFAEEQRRYIEPPSSYAGMFLEGMDRPDVDFIERLSPAVSTNQKSTNHNPRSTIGMVVEIYGYLRLLLVRADVQSCPECDEQIRAQSAEQIADNVSALSKGTCFQILAPVARDREGEYAEPLSQLASDGFSQTRVDDEVVRLDNPLKLKKDVKHDIDIIVDRFVIRDGTSSCLNDPIRTVLGLADGFVIVEKIDAPADDPTYERRYPEKRLCPNEYELGIEEVEPRAFSFDTPYGVYPACDRIGSHLQVDLELVVPDDSPTLREGTVALWTIHQDFFTRQLEALGEDLGFDANMPWRDLPTKAKDTILCGKDYKARVIYRSRWGEERTYGTGFEGVVAYVKRKHGETESD